MGELISSLRGKCDFESDGSMYSSYVSFLFFFFGWIITRSIRTRARWMEVGPFDIRGQAED